MITIFVTGGIGSGKSTLMRFFEAKGAGVVYADKVGHENLHNAAMKDELRAAFGNKIFDSEGEIVRSELAACAFLTGAMTFTRRPTSLLRLQPLQRFALLD